MADWGAYYSRLREVAVSYTLPIYEIGQAVDNNELARVSLKVQTVRDWFTDAYAAAQQKLSEAKRELIFAEYDRKVKFNAHLAIGEEVTRCKTKEQRAAMANMICMDEDKLVVEIRSVIINWEAAALVIDQYLKSVETAKVTIGRIQKAAVAEIENL